MDDPEGASLVLKSLAALLAAGAAVADPAAGVVVAGAVPVVDEMQHRWLVRQREKVEITIAAAIQRAGLSAEEMLERLTSDPVRLALLGEVLTAAAKTATDTKLIALASSLAAGAVGADPIVEEERIWTQIVSELEAPHIQALDVLARSQPAGVSSFDWTVGQWQALAEALKPYRRVVQERVLTSLERLGLARWRYGDQLPKSYELDTGGWAGDRFWSITELLR